MKKSRPYQAVGVKEIRIPDLASNRPGMECHVGLDCSKQEVLAVVRWTDRSFERPWRVKLHEQELGVLVERLRELEAGRQMTVALEPTGTYCDPVRQALSEAGLQVYRVNPKASHDFAEIFDGVPSQHDGKDAACVAELSAIHKHTAWPWNTESQELRHEIEWMDNQQRMLTRWLGQLESSLGRHWPELSGILELSSATMLWLLTTYGGPEGVRDDAQMRSLLRKKSYGGLTEEKIDRVLDSARNTIGTTQTPADVRQMKRYAEEALRASIEIRKCRKRIRELTKGNFVVELLARIVGLNTASICWAHIGDPAKYHSSRAYLKAFGLNLKERSSGRYQGQLKITKRGPSRPRRWLYFAALRYAKDPWIRPWFESKKQRGSGHARRALISLMRKIVMAMYQVRVHGKPFDVHALLPGAAKCQPKKKSQRQRVEIEA